MSKSFRGNGARVRAVAAPGGRGVAVVKAEENSRFPAGRPTRKATTKATRKATAKATTKETAKATRKATAKATAKARTRARTKTKTRASEEMVGACAQWLHAMRGVGAGINFIYAD